MTRSMCARTSGSSDWVVQLGRNLLMNLEDTGSRARFLTRDPDSKFTQAFDTMLAEAGMDVVTSGIRMPRMNSIMERWIQTCRRELLDRTLIWDQRHLLHALREFESFYNGIGPTGPWRKPLRSAHCPNRARNQKGSNAWTSADGTDSAEPSTSTNMPPEQDG
jgi:putative transposase